jgi:hypothetical protein
MNSLTTEIKFSSDISLEKIWNKTYDQEKYKLNFKNIDYKEEKYVMVNYIKKHLNYTNENELKNIRSLIFDDTGKLLCFAPQKSIKTHLLSKLEDLSYIKNTRVEPLIEGTMINVFYDKRNDSWIFCTKGNIGASQSFFRVGVKGISFLDMFYECCKKQNINIEDLPKDYCYSFVIQHVDNRLVSRFNTNNIILIRMYEITQKNGINHVNVINTYMENNSQDGHYTHRDIVINRLSKFSNSSIIKQICIQNYKEDKQIILNCVNILETPMTSVFNNCKNIDDYIRSSITVYNNHDIFWMSHIGINIVYNETDDRERYRHQVYQDVRLLRGNQPKLEYHYLDLRRQNKINMFLTYYPEYRKEFNEYQNKVHTFTENLYKNYVSCYIKKTKPLIEYPKEYRTHMFNLHDQYKKIRDHGEYIRMKNVIEYFNSLKSDIILYSLNFSKRQPKVQNESI